MSRHNRFSLIEMLVVMAIIVLLASIVSGGAVYVRRNARASKAKAQIKMIETALIEYESEYGYYPQQSSIGAIKKSVLSSLVYPNGTRMIDLDEEIFSDSTGEDLVDAYGNPIYYLAPGKMNKKAFDLWSMGPDGKHGAGGGALTASEDTDDVNNWTRK